MDPEQIMLNERSQSQRPTYCMIPCMWNVQSRQIPRDTKQALEVVEWGLIADGYRFFSTGNFRGSEMRVWSWLHNSENILKTTKLYTWHGRILGYVNYIPIKLLNIVYRYSLIIHSFIIYLLSPLAGARHTKVNEMNVHRDELLLSWDNTRA